MKHRTRMLLGALLLSSGGVVQAFDCSGQHQRHLLKTWRDSAATVLRALQSH